MSSPATIGVLHDVPVPTWFGVGGRADALAAPGSREELQAVLAEHDPALGPVRVLGDGANLLVADVGVDGLVLSLSRLNSTEWHESGVRAQAGAGLPKLVVESVRRGLSGLEGLGGIPATLGGAIRMNAGGAFGEIGETVRCVDVIDASGALTTRSGRELSFGYRRSNLGDVVIVSAELSLPPGDAEALRARLKEVMAHKKDAQPLADRSAGCVFKNPTVRGRRVSAGRLIDKAGAKGLRVGGASVSERHGNFIVVGDGATATDVLDLIDTVRRRVRDHAGVELEQELVVWSRGDGHA